MRIIFAVLLFTGCSAHGSDNHDAGPLADLAVVDAGDQFVPVSPPPLPIIPNHGGPIIASPQIVTLTWQSDTIAADLEAFDDWEVTSTFWKDMMAEWGVGPGTHAASYRVPSPAPATLDEAAITTLLTDVVTRAVVPAPAPSIIYTLYPPSGTTVTETGGFAGCVAFQAYHSQTMVNGVQAFYAVAPRCANTSGLSAVDYTTWGMSHEVMEASSDPDFLHPTWVITKQSVATPELGENADLCASHPAKIEGHEVTLNYSNVAAMKGERPCVPAPDGPMFGVFPESPEVNIVPGLTATMTLHFYSTAPLAAFTLSVTSRSTTLTAKLDKKSGQNGDTATLTITAAPDYVESEGANLIDLYTVSDGYLTRRDLIVHAR